MPKHTSEKGNYTHMFFSLIIHIDRVACFELDEYETALSAFEKAASLDASDTSFKTWIRKCQAEIESMILFHLFN